MCAAGCAEEPSTAVVTGAPDGTSISEPDDTPTLDPAGTSVLQPSGAPTSTPTPGTAGTPGSKPDGAPAPLPSGAPTSTPAGTPTPGGAGAPHSAPGGASTSQPADSSSSASPSPGKDQLASPELGTHLDDLASRLEAGGLSEEEIAAAAPLSRGGSVGITVHVDGSVDGVVALLADNGVLPRHVGEGFVEAFVPVRLLRQVGGADGVLFVEPIVPPEALEPEASFTDSGQDG